MSDWDDACDPVQPVREREERRSNKARAHWQRRQIQQGKAVGKMAKPGAIEPDFYEEA